MAAAVAEFQRVMADATGCLIAHGKPPGERTAAAAAVNAAGVALWKNSPKVALQIIKEEEAYARALQVVLRASRLRTDQRYALVKKNGAIMRWLPRPTRLGKRSRLLRTVLGIIARMRREVRLEMIACSVLSGVPVEF